jgi:hypothetical protein
VVFLDFGTVLIVCYFQKYHTIKTVPKSKNTPPSRTVPKSKNTPLSEQFQIPKIPHHQNTSKIQKYHTIRTVPKSKNTTPSEQFQNPKIPGIFGFWNCFDGVVFLEFGTVLMVWYFSILKLF